MNRLANARSAATRLLDSAKDLFFRALRQSLEGEAAPPFAEAFAVGVVLRGSGTVHGTRTGHELRAGSTFGLPAASVSGTRPSGDELEVAWCLGPDPAALQADSLSVLMPR